MGKSDYEQGLDGGIKVGKAMSSKLRDKVSELEGRLLVHMCAVEGLLEALGEIEELTRFESSMLHQRVNVIASVARSALEPESTDEG